MVKAKTGSSQGSDSHKVAVEATTAAYLPDDNPIVVIVFSSPKYDSEKVLQGVESVVGNDLPMVGATTSGEITEDGPLETESVVVMIIYGENVRAYTAIGTGLEDDAHLAGEKMATSLLESAGEDRPTFLILLDDVLTNNGTDMLDGIKSVMGKHFPLIGGAAGDDFNFEKTYQFHNGKVYSSTVVGLSLVGDISFGVGVRHGWSPLGPAMRITKTKGNVVCEIDGRPAIDVYKEYLGEENAKSMQSEVIAKSALTYPLGIKMPDNDSHRLSAPLIAKEDGSVTFGVEIEEGSEVRLMFGDQDGAIKHAKLAAETAKKGLDVEPSFALIFNCVGRNKLLSDKNHKEIEAIKSSLGPSVPMAGFYTYAEQAPWRGDSHHFDKCEANIHNETVVVLALA